LSGYELVIWWSEDDTAFLVEVPELPGGRSHEEAVANVRVIVDEWIATAKTLGRDVPQPLGRLPFA
jgi:predicted RNase H-like HicB family nuclease